MEVMAIIPMAMVHGLGKQMPKESVQESEFK